MGNKICSRKKAHDSRNYYRTQMQKKAVIQKLQEKKYRITKQRLMLLDIVLKNECANCKEIYYKAVKVDENIGTATVYRMMSILEEIGAIKRNNIYRIDCSIEYLKKDTCIVELDDDNRILLSSKKLKEVICSGLKACGYIDRQEIKSVTVQEY